MKTTTDPLAYRLFSIAGLALLAASTTPSLFRDRIRGDSCQLSGTVLQSDGLRPARNTWVHAFDISTGLRADPTFEMLEDAARAQGRGIDPREKYRTMTTTEGQFRFDSLDPGKYVIVAWRTPENGAISGELVLNAGDKPADIRLVLPEDHYLFGRVRMAATSWVPTLRLRGVFSEVTSSKFRKLYAHRFYSPIHEDGRFTLGPLPSGKLNLSLELFGDRFPDTDGSLGCASWDVAPCETNALHCGECVIQYGHDQLFERSIDAKAFGILDFTLLRGGLPARGEEIYVLAEDAKRSSVTKFDLKDSSTVIVAAGRTLRVGFGRTDAQGHAKIPLPPGEWTIVRDFAMPGKYGAWGTAFKAHISIKGGDVVCEVADAYDSAKER